MATKNAKRREKTGKITTEAQRHGEEEKRRKGTRRCRKARKRRSDVGPSD
jgi:hypothetical protein